MLVRIIGEDVALHTRLDPQLDPVKVDPGQFEQVLVNLAVNARDAMPGGGQMVIETTNVEIGDPYGALHPDLSPGRYVLLAVTDTGHGMPDEVKERLFEPFFTTKPKGRGTGLGLATIFGTVKQAGGSIEVDSEMGHGTRFQIFLPAAGAREEVLPPRQSVPELAQGHETVLLVEDEVSVREFAVAVLRRLGYRVLAACNGADALRQVGQHAEPIDLLMTDVVMPGMNGRELAERLTTSHSQLKVLFTSGYTEDIIDQHGVLEEKLHFIAKPYSLAALATKLREVLDPRAK
jgi:CheY-like chemotaxis protein